MSDSSKPLKPQKIAASDPRDSNGDGTWSVAEQKTWNSQNPEDAYNKWGWDLAVIKELGLADFFHQQFLNYKKNPAGFSDAAFIRDLKKQPKFQAANKSYQQDLEFEKTLPQQWEEAVTADVDSLRDQAKAIGASVDDATLRELAIKARRGGLNTAQMKDQLAQHLTVQGDRYMGAAGSVQDSLEQWANENGLRISKTAVRDYVQKISAGDTTEDDVKSDLRKTYLAGMYPAWADKINAGYDPSAIFSPYLNSAKQLLEDDSLSLQDPIMQKISQYVGPDGKPAVVPLYEAQQMIRKDPRWQKTDNAYATYSSVADDVLKMFGFR